MKGIFELLKISLEGEKLSEVKKESLYDRILAKIELHELLHAEQLFLYLGEGEVIVQGEKPSWSWSVQMFARIPSNYNEGRYGQLHTSELIEFSDG